MTNGQYVQGGGSSTPSVRINWTMTASTDTTPAAQAVTRITDELPSSRMAAITGEAASKISAILEQIPCDLSQQPTILRLASTHHLDGPDGTNTITLTLVTTCRRYINETWLTIMVDKVIQYLNTLIAALVNNEPFDKTFEWRVGTEEAIDLYAELENNP